MGGRLATSRLHCQLHCQLHSQLHCQLHSQLHSQLQHAQGRECRKFDHKKQSKSAEEFLLFAPTARSRRVLFRTTSIAQKFVDFEELRPGQVTVVTATWVALAAVLSTRGRTSLIW